MEALAAHPLPPLSLRVQSYERSPAGVVLRAMQRFRDAPERWGVNKWKKNGGEPLKLDKQYVPFREVYPMQIRNWVVGKGKNVKRESRCLLS